MISIRLWLYLGAAVAVVAGLWYLHAKIDAQGYQRGRSEIEAAYVKRDQAAQAAAEQRIAQLTAEKAAIEQRWQTAAAATAQKFNVEKRDAEKKLADLNRR